MVPGTGVDVSLNQEGISLDPRLQEHHIRPYQVRDSGKSLSYVFADINENVFKGFGPYRAPNDNSVKVDLDNLFQYERLLKGLNAIAGLEMVTHYDLHVRPHPPEGRRGSIRHDVDFDIVTALAMARFEHQHGIRSTFYILHTARYYGEFRDDIFYRNECLGRVYKEIQDLGHEVALHHDPLLIYQQHKMDGAMALVEEIRWLRSLGIDIRGCVAHNSAPEYGISNRAIFKGKMEHMDKKVLDLPPDSTEVVWNGNWSPLQVLDMTEMGLEYEGYDVLMADNAKRYYYASIRSANTWNERAHSKARQKLKKEGKLVVDRRFNDQDRVVQNLSQLEPGNFGVLVVHPIYYGCRVSAKSNPITRHSSRETAINPDLGWETYKPYSLQSRFGESYPGEQEFQAINFANGWGMLDLPHNREVSQDARRILILGGQNMDGDTTAVSTQFHVHLAEMLTEQIDVPVVTYKLAYPGMGFTRLWGWYQAVKQQIRPHLVILGVGADDIVHCLPVCWSKTSGYAPSRPPGEYLHWDGEKVSVVRRHQLAHVYSSLPNPDFKPTSSLTQTQGTWNVRYPKKQILPYLSHCLRYFVDQIRKDGAKPLLMLQECGENAGLWHQSVSPDLREEGYRRCAGEIEQLAQEAQVQWVDSYAKLLHESSLPTHWQGQSQWNYTGHRLIAETLIEYLMQRKDEMLI